MKHAIMLLILALAIAGCTAPADTEIPETENTAPQVPEAQQESAPQVPAETAEQGTPVFDITIIDQLMSPAQLRARAGDTIVLRIDNRDGASIFSLTAYGIEERLPAQSVTEIEFEAQEPGTALYSCSECAAAGVLVIE